MTGARWTSASALGVAGLQILQTLVLVRLLDPDDFGLMAALTVVIGLAQGFRDAGIANAIIVRDVPRAALSSLYWLNLCSGVLLAAILLASTAPIADFYGDDRLHDLVPWAALLFVIGPLGVVPQALLEKQLRFDLAARAEVAGAIAGFAVAVASASAGEGARALVWGLLAATAVRSLLLFAGARRIWRPQLRFRAADVREHLSFGAYQMGERAVNYLAANVDYILIGRFLGPGALGIYSIAYSLALRPLAQLNPVLLRVATPVFARRQRDDAALRRGFLEVSHLIALVTFPLLTLLAVAAPVLVPFALGERWEASVTVIQILAFLGLLRTLGNPLGSILLAKDRPDLGFKINVGLLIVMAVGLRLVVESGIESVAWAYLGIGAGALLVVQPLVLRRLIKLSPVRYARELARPTLFTLSLAAASSAAFFALSDWASDGLATAAVLLAGATVYALLLARFERSYLREVWQLVRGRRAATT